MFLKEGTFGIFPADICKGRNPIQQAIICWLWFHKNKEGVCWPSQKTISEECGISRSTLNDHLLILEKEGVIIRKEQIRDNGGKASTLYSLPMSAKRTTPCPPNGQPHVRQTETNYNHIEPKPKELKKIYKKEIEDYISANPKSVTSKVADYFLKLGWTPKHGIEDLREWLLELSKSTGKTPEQIESISSEWYIYWLGRKEDKQIKNFKTCFGNCYLFKNQDTWKK